MTPPPSPRADLDAPPIALKPAARDSAVSEATAQAATPANTARHRLVDTPLGVITLVARGEALVGVYWPDHRPEPDRTTFGEVADEGDVLLQEVASQMSDYFAGHRTDFALPLARRGTDFQEQVWRQLERIPHGQVRSYRQIAQEIGRPKAVRAVGAANARNPLSIVVPCHRVVSSTGAAHGYAGSLAAKEWLLSHEGVDLTTSKPQG